LQVTVTVNGFGGLFYVLSSDLRVGVGYGVKSFERPVELAG
jgi:hypothetical protein